MGGGHTYFRALARGGALRTSGIPDELIVGHLNALHEASCCDTWRHAVRHASSLRARTGRRAPGAAGRPAFARFATCTSATWQHGASRALPCLAPRARPMGLRCARAGRLGRGGHGLPAAAQPALVQCAPARSVLSSTYRCGALRAFGRLPGCTHCPPAADGIATRT